MELDTSFNFGVRVEMKENILMCDYFYTFFNSKMAVVCQTINSYVISYLFSYIEMIIYWKYDFYVVGWWLLVRNFRPRFLSFEALISQNHKGRKLLKRFSVVYNLLCSPTLDYWLPWMFSMAAVTVNWRDHYSSIIPASVYYKHYH